MANEAQPPAPRSGTQSVGRALAVLDAIAGAEGGLGVTEVAQRTGLTVSTAHRLTRSLCDAGLVAQDLRSERYGLGPRLVVLGRRAEQQLGYATIRPALEALAERTGESVNLGIRAGAEVLVVVDVASSQPLRFDQELGTRVPVHTSAMGKCLVAFGSGSIDAELESLPGLDPLTPRTITDRRALRRELDVVRQRGWALNDEERHPGVRAVAVPVLDAGGAAVAAIAVQGPTVRMGDERLAAVADDVAATAARVAPLLAATVQ